MSSFFLMDTGIPPTKATKCAQDRDLFERTAVLSHIHIICHPRHIRQLADDFRSKANDSREFDRVIELGVRCEDDEWKTYWELIRQTMANNRMCDQRFPLTELALLGQNYSYKLVSPNRQFIAKRWVWRLLDIAKEMGDVVTTSRYFAPWGLTFAGPLWK